MSDIGDRFQKETKYLRGKIPHSVPDQRQPEWTKRYPEAPQIKLPTPRTKGSASLWEALKNRRSARVFRGAPVTITELSRLLWAAQGVTHRAGEYAFRTAPSAGALYPVETYLVSNTVQGIAPGVYHYAIGEHLLEQLGTGDFRAPVARAALDQRMAHDADLVFIWSAVFPRGKWKYQQRAYRYAYLDVGHIAQNVALAAVALRLTSCQIAALYDDEANALLGIDGQDESVIYMTVVGRAR